MEKVTHVAVGVIENTKGEVLVAKRDQDKHQGGKWEFPGGKVEPNEAVQDALIREFKEEVDLDLTGYLITPFMKRQYFYPGKSVLLDTFYVSNVAEVARSNEGQEVKWVPKIDLLNLQFPSANRSLLFKLLLDTLKPKRFIQQSKVVLECFDSLAFEGMICDIEDIGNKDLDFLVIEFKSWSSLSKSDLLKNISSVDTPILLEKASESLCIDIGVSGAIELN